MMNNYQTITDYYARYRDEIVGFIALRLGNHDDAEDIVQDIFVRLLRSDKLISDITLPALVYTIARHKISDYYRRRHTFEEYEHFIKRGDAVDDCLESVISARELTERMEYTLARLAPECREAYRLHIYGGMAVSQIAEQTGQPYRNVEYRLGIARRAVRNALLKAI